MKRLSLKTKKFQKKKPMSAQSKLIDLIFERHGGIVKVAKKVKVSKQVVLIWRNKGYVPLGKVNKIAKILGVNPLALNYKEYSEFMSPTISFDTVCEICREHLASLKDIPC